MKLGRKERILVTVVVGSCEFLSLPSFVLGNETYSKPALQAQFWLKHWEVQFDPQFTSSSPGIVADEFARSLASPDTDSGQGGTLQEGR